MLGLDARTWRPAVCVFLPQLPHRWPGLGPDGAADAEAEPPRRRPHPALVCTDKPTAHTHIVAYNDLPCSIHTIHRIKDNWQHLKRLKRFCFVPLSSEKQSEGCPGAARTVCAKTLCHTARDCRRLLFFWPFGVFDFSQGREIRPNYLQTHTDVSIVFKTLPRHYCHRLYALSKREQSSHQTTLSLRQREEEREKRKRQSWKLEK